MKQATRKLELRSEIVRGLVTLDEPKLLRVLGAHQTVQREDLAESGRVCAAIRIVDPSVKC